MPVDVNNHDYLFAAPESRALQFLLLPYMTFDSYRAVWKVGRMRQRILSFATRRPCPLPKMLPRNPLTLENVLHCHLAWHRGTTFTAADFRHPWRFYAFSARCSTR